MTRFNELKSFGISDDAAQCLDGAINSARSVLGPDPKVTVANLDGKDSKVVPSIMIEGNGSSIEFDPWIAQVQTDEPNNNRSLSPKEKLLFDTFESCRPKLFNNTP